MHLTSLGAGVVVVGDASDELFTVVVKGVLVVWEGLTFGAKVVVALDGGPLVAVSVVVVKGVKFPSMDAGPLVDDGCDVVGLLVVVGPCVVSAVVVGNRLVVVGGKVVVVVDVGTLLVCGSESVVVVWLVVIGETVVESVFVEGGSLLEI